MTSGSNRDETLSRTPHRRCDRRRVDHRRAVDASAGGAAGECDFICDIHQVAALAAPDPGDRAERDRLPGGNRAGRSLASSGPAVYVFDRSGRLVDWSGDMGDDSRFQQKWLPASGLAGTPLDMDGATKWINSAPAAG